MADDVAWWALVVLAWLLVIATAALVLRAVCSEQLDGEADDREQE